MANLTRNSPRTFQGAAPPGSNVALAVDANTQLFAGAAVMRSAANGALINCVPTASGKFAGFCTEEVDNRTGSILGGTAGSATAQVQMEGTVWLNVAHSTTFARQDADALIYASDGDTFTVSAGTNNIVVGRLVLVPELVIGASSGLVLVAFEATSHRSI